MPQGSRSGPGLAQLMTFAKMRAALVLPTPLGPQNRYACASCPLKTEFLRVWAMLSWPISEENDAGLYFRADTIYSDIVSIFDILTKVNIFSDNRNKFCNFALTMKRTILILLLLLAASMQAFCQLQIRTRGDKISDFRTKTTMVVLSGDEALDKAILGAVKSFWTVTPYEPCQMSEFEKLKVDENYYFLVVTPDGEGARSWYLVKGGGSAKTKITSMVNVIDVPICPEEGLTGREAALLPAIVVSIQKAIDIGFKGIDDVVTSLKRASRLPLYLPSEQISRKAGKGVAEKCSQKNIQVVDTARADEIFTLGENGAVAFAVGPYTYLFDASTFELYYFAKHKVKAADYGIQADDIKTFLKSR